MMAFPLAHCLLCVHLKFMNLENSYLNMHFHFHTMLPVTTGKNKGTKTHEVLYIYRFGFGQEPLCHCDLC